MNQPDVDVIVVGGGIAGMASAWALRDVDVLLLEESNQLGGRIKSVARGDYWLNLGAHLFPGAGSAIQRLIGDLGLHTVEIPGSKAGIFFDGKVVVRNMIETYPLTLPLTLRERFSFATVGLGLLTLVKKWQRASKPRVGESESQRRSRLAHYESHRSFREVIGHPPGRVNDLFETAARRASCEIEEQSAAVGAALFASHWSGKGGSTALNLMGGSGLLPQRIQEKMGSHVLLHSRVTNIRSDHERVTVTYEDPTGTHAISARHVIVAVPAPVARAIVDNAPQDVDRALGTVRYGQFLVMSMATSETSPMPWDDVYALTTPGLTFSMFFNHANPLRTKGIRKPGGSIMCYAGGDLARRAMELSDEDIESMFKQDLYRLYPQLGGLIGETLIQRWPIGGQYRGPGDNGLDALLQYAAESDHNVHYAGDYFAPLGQMEVAASSGVAAAQRVLQALARRADRRTASKSADNR